jgi:hypothetical protein
LTDDPLPQEVTVTSEYIEHGDSNIQENFVTEDDFQSTQSQPIHRNRSHPRNWVISRETHDTPNFDRKFEPKFEFNHKTQPITIFESFFPDYLIQVIVQQTNRYALYKYSVSLHKVHILKLGILWQRSHYAGPADLPRR